MTEIAKVFRLRDLVEDLEADFKRKDIAKSTGLAAGPISSFEKLDSELGGSFATGVHVVQGAPGSGKTSLGVYISARCSAPALYLTAEMAPLELFRRHIARESGLHLSKFDVLNWDSLRQRAEDTAAALPLLSIMDATACKATASQLGEVLDELRERGNDRVPLLLVDSLQVWARQVSYSSVEYEAINHAVKTLAELAQAKDVPILAISHRSRAGQDRGGLFASKGSGDIEYAAESVIDVAMPENPRPKASGEIELTLTIHKNRHGAPGTIIKVRFNPGLQWFCGVDR